MKTIILSALAVAAAGLSAPSVQAAEPMAAHGCPSAEMHRAAAPAPARRVRHHPKHAHRVAIKDRARATPPPPPVETTSAIATQPKADRRHKP